MRIHTLPGVLDDARLFLRYLRSLNWFVLVLIQRIRITVVDALKGHSEGWRSGGQLSYVSAHNSVSWITPKCVASSIFTASERKQYTQRVQHTVVKTLPDVGSYLSIAVSNRPAAAVASLLLSVVQHGPIALTATLLEIFARRYTASSL